MYNHLTLQMYDPTLERSDYVGKAERTQSSTTVERLQTQLKEKLKLPVEDIPMLDSQRIRRPNRT